MSCYMDVWCMDCDKKCGIDNANREYEVVTGIAAMGPELAQLAKVNRESLEICIGGYRVCMGFFEEHGAHRLRARTEWGELVDRCGDYTYEAIIAAEEKEDDRFDMIWRHASPIAMEMYLGHREAPTLVNGKWKKGRLR